MGGTPLDWERQAQSIGTFNVPVAAAPFAAAAEPDEYDELLRRRRAKSRQAQLEAEIDEEEEERQLKMAQRRAKIMQANAQIAALTNPQQSNGNASTEMVVNIMREAADDRKELLGELIKARSEAGNAANTQLMQSIQALQQRVEALSAPGSNGGDPISQLVTQLRAVKEVRSALDDAVPPAPVVNPAQSRSQLLEEMRIEEETKLRRLQSEAVLEDARAARESVIAERDLKRHRVDRSTEMVENVLGPIAAALGSEGIGNKLSGLFGGDKPEAPPGTAAPATAPAAAEEPPADPGAMPWICPNDECGFTNHSPEGTTFAVCARCKMGVTLTPTGQEEDGGFEQV